MSKPFQTDAIISAIARSARVWHTAIHIEAFQDTTTSASEQTIVVWATIKKTPRTYRITIATNGTIRADRIK